MSEKIKNLQITQLGGKKILIFLAISISLVTLLISPNPAKAQNLENEVNFREINEKENHISSRIQMKISVLNFSSGDSYVSKEGIAIKNTVFQIKNTNLNVKNLKVTEKDVKNIISDFEDYLNNQPENSKQGGGEQVKQGGGGQGEGTPTAFSMRGHVLQMKNLYLGGYRKGDRGYRIGFSFDNQVLVLNEPIVTTDTAVGNLSLSYGTFTQSIENFSLGIMSEPSTDFAPDNIHAVLKNLNVEMVNPTIVADLPFTGKTSFALSDQPINIEHVSTSISVLENSPINANINIQEQKTKIPSLDGDSISISGINVENKSIILNTPSSLEMIGFGDIKLSYDYVTQSLKNLNVNIENVSLSNPSLNDSTINLKDLKVEVINPALSIEIPILGLLSAKSNQINLENMETSIENLTVEKLSMDENIWNYVQFEKASVNQKISEIGKLTIEIDDIEGRQNNPVFSEPQISLKQPKYIGFNLKLNKLNTDKLSKTEVKNASFSLNVPSLGVVTWQLEGIMPTETQILTATLPLLGVIFFFTRVRKRKKKENPKNKR